MKTTVTTYEEMDTACEAIWRASPYFSTIIAWEDHHAVVDELTDLAWEQLDIAADLQERYLQIHLHGLAEQLVPDDRAVPVLDGDADGGDDDGWLDDPADDLGEARLIPSNPLRGEDQLERAMRLEWAQHAGRLLHDVLLNALLGSFNRHWSISGETRGDLVREMVRHLFDGMIRNTGAWRRMSDLFGREPDREPAF